MYRLEFRSADGSTTTIDERRVVTIGRGEDNDIVLNSPSVSRKHAELRPTQTGWDLYDVGSGGGTWVNSERVAQVPLTATTTVRFGAESDGVEATITIDLPDGAAAEVADDQKTSVLPDQQRTDVPGGVQAPGEHPTGLLIRTRDGDKRFDGSKPIRIGRDVRSDVIADDPAVSRHHAEVQRRADGWWFVDHSNSGSFVDGERVREKEITEEMVVQLGHPAAGYQVTLVPVSDVASAQKAIAGKRRRRRGVIVAAGIAVIALVAAGVVASVMWPREKPEQNTLSAANLERAKKASVQIVAFSKGGDPMWTGSGTIISPDGLILTNAHVAKPTAKGMPDADNATDPGYFEIAFAKDDNTPAAPRYRAKTLVAEGYLDLAVVKIDANADGTPLEGGKAVLPEPVPIGDSNALRTGDRITTLGYPGLTSDHHNTGPLTITSGDVSAFKRDYATNTDRFWIDTTARIAHGNSGGAAVNTRGELIAVNTRYATGQPDDPVSFLTRPIALGKDLIEKARGGGDPNYVSPFLDKIQRLPEGAKATSGGWQKTPSADCGQARDPDELNRLSGVSDGETVYAKFEISGIPNDVPVMIQFQDIDNGALVDNVEGLWQQGEAPLCLARHFKFKTGLHRVAAVFAAGYQNELQVGNAVQFD
jgi:putative serine protease PepD